MENIKRFEPIFGEWHFSELISSDDRETLFKAYREKDGEREYCTVKHIPIPAEESIVEALAAGGMEPETLEAYTEARLRDANREAAIAQRLSSAHGVVSYEQIDRVQRENGGCDMFIRMPELTPLSKRQEEKPLTAEETANLGADIADALCALSANGIIHRNVSPDTIFLTSDGKAMLGGLGGARLNGTSSGEEEEGIRLYAAPEVIKGEPETPASDIYSLGLVLYRLMNRDRMPFEPAPPLPVSKAQSETAALRRVAGAKLPEPREAEGELAGIILKACALDPGERFPSAEAMRGALRDLLAGAGKTEASDNVPAAPAPAAPAPAAPAAEKSPEPLPTAPKEPVTPVIGTAAMPVTNEPAPGKAEKKAARLAEKERKKKEKQLEKQRRYEEESREEYEEESGEMPGEEPGEEPRRTDRGLKVGIIIAAIIAGLALLGVVGMLLKGVIEDLRAQREEKAFKPHPPVVTRDSQDPDIYRVTIYAKNGSSVVYENLRGTRREYTVNTDNRIVFEIRGSDLVPDEPVDSTAYSVQPKFYTRNDQGELEPISDMEFIMIEIPELELTLDCGESILTDNGKVHLEGTLGSRDAELVIDGQRIEPGIDGRFAYDREFEENGEYTIEVTAQQPKYAIFRRSIPVTVDIPEPPVIQLPWDMGETKYSQRVTEPGDTVEVHGMIPAGSALTVACANELVMMTEPAVKEDGSFSFSAALPETGDYTLTLTCVTPEGEEVTRDMHVQRAPEWKPYVESAWAMNYDALTRPSKQCYNIKGKVTQIIEDGDRYLVALETKDGGTLLLEYHYHYPSANKFTEGKEYSWIYGFPMGRNAEGAPVVYVWFVNDR